MIKTDMWNLKNIMSLMQNNLRKFGVIKDLFEAR